MLKKIVNCMREVKSEKYVGLVMVWCLCVVASPNIYFCIASTTTTTTTQRTEKYYLRLDRDHTHTHIRFCCAVSFYCGGIFQCIIVVVHLVSHNHSTCNVRAYRPRSTYFIYILNMLDCVVCV